MLGRIEGRRRGRQRMMVGWHHQLGGRESEQTLVNNEGQGSLMCYIVHGVEKSRRRLSD